MEKLRLELINNRHKNQYLNMIEECEEDIKTTGFELYIPISNKDSFEEDMYKLKQRHEGVNLENGWVPESVFWLMNENSNELIGVIAIRHKLI